MPLHLTPYRPLALSVAVAAALAAFAAAPANASEISIVGTQPGAVGVNCGTGLHSTFIGAPGSTVTEFNINGINGATAATSCSASNGPSNFFQDYGAMPSGTYGNLTVTNTGAEILVGTSGSGAAPWADSAPYLAVPRPGTTGGSINFAINPATDDNYFGIYWGSIDTANTITFTLSDGSQVTVTGADLGSADDLSENGVNQVTTSTNEFVDFETAQGLYIDDVTLSDGTSVAFEVANPAFGNVDPPPVPEPASLTLFGSALLGLGALRRRKKS